MPLDAAHMAELLTVLSGRYSIDLCDGKVRLVGRDLPGDAVAVVCPPKNGVTLVIYDLRKPDALGHARALLHDYWTSIVEPVAFPDGTVELMPQVMPLPTQRGPVEILAAV